MTAPTDLTAWLDGLEAARKAATPGPWEIAGGRRLTYDNGASEAVTAVRVNHAAGPWERIWVRRDMDAADAALIVAAVNALPELVAVLRGVLALAEELDDIAAMNDESATASSPGSAHGARHTGLRDSARDAADRIRAVVAAAHTEVSR